MSEPTCLPASIVADTIMRTIELGVTITDAALDREVTVVFCDLLVDGPDRCSSCSQAGTYRDTIVRTVTDLPVAGHPLQLRVRRGAVRRDRWGEEGVRGPVVHATGLCSAPLPVRERLV